VRKYVVIGVLMSLSVKIGFCVRARETVKTLRNYKLKYDGETFERYKCLKKKNKNNKPVYRDRLSHDDWYRKNRWQSPCSAYE